MQHKVGKVFFADTGFLIGRDPDTVRAPHIALSARNGSKANCPKRPSGPELLTLPSKWFSPGDTTGELDDKVKAWLDASAAAVWVVNPKWSGVTVYRSVTEVTTLTANDLLDGGDVVSGFQCQVRDVFAGP